VRVARGQTEEGWTQRGKRGTTASSQTSSHPNSVHLDDATTLWGLECLQADLCGLLGDISTCPSTLSDCLLRCAGGEDAGLWQPGKDRLCRTLNLSHFVARKIWRKCGGSSRRCRTHRLQRRGPPRCLLVPMDTTFDLLQTARN
jgi:hypothetical protein